MAQKKGQTGNKNGRPKGSPNKSTAEIKEAVKQLVSKNIDQLDEDLKKLPAKDRLAMIEKLLKYVIPQQQKMEITEPEPSTLDRITFVIGGRD